MWLQILFRSPLGLFALASCDSAVTLKCFHIFKHFQLFLYEVSKSLLEVEGSILRFKEPKGDVENELGAPENYLQLCVKWARSFLRLLIWRKIEMSINNALGWFLRLALGNVH